MISLIKIYDFSEDENYKVFLKDMVFSSRFGNKSIKALDGLIPGTNEWFEGVKSGQIPTFEIKGIISDVYMSGHNDFPEIEIESKGVKTSWARVGDITKYIVNREIVLRFTEQRIINSQMDTHKTILEVHVSNS